MRPDLRVIAGRPVRNDLLDHRDDALDVEEDFDPVRGAVVLFYGVALFVIVFAVCALMLALERVTS
jgi:hypothetical protein